MNRTISVLLTGSSASLRAQLGLAARALGDLDNTGRSVGQNLRTGLLAATTAVAAGLALMVKTSAEFDAAMRNVNSISQLTEQAFGALEQKVLDLAKSGEVTQSATTLAKGLYDIASSGFHGAEGLEVLEEAAKAASAGLTDTATSSKAIVAVLNAYGLEAEDAAHVSDVLFQTVNLGVVSFSELATQLGDVVGGAAAAGVSIEQVGGAIAAMTLSGISAAESATSLNRLITALIKPSDALAATFKTLGINIVRDLKDPAIGLHGVMEQLRDSTNGNIEAYLALFPEIRAARGAFALAANEGQNYERAMNGIADQTSLTGATQRALDEQMKSLSAQWKVFTTQVNAGATELGLRFIPVLIDALHATRDLGGAGIGGLVDQLRRLAPLWDSLKSAGADVAEVFRNIWAFLEPLIVGLGAVAATGVVAAFNALGEALAATSGYLAENEGLVRAVVFVLGVMLVNAAINAGVALGGMALAAVASNMVGLAWAVRGVVVSLTTLRGAVAASGLIALTATIGAVTAGMVNSSRRADEMYAALVRPFDLTSYRGLTDALDEIGVKQQELEANTKTQGGWFNALRGAVELITPMKNSVQEAREELEKFNEETPKLAAIRINIHSNAGALAAQLGLTRAEAESVAKWMGVDLTQSFEKSGSQRQQMINDFKAMEKAAGPMATEMLKAGQISVEQLEAIAKASEEAKEATSKAFRQDTDLISGYANAIKAQKQGSESLLTARKRLADAEDRLADIRQRQSADNEDTVSDQIALRNALDDVSEANLGVSKAQEEVSKTGLTGFFTRTKQEAEDFVNNIRTAAEKGLDPHLIQSLLQAGPEAAKPILEAIAADLDGNLTRQFNSTQETLNKINLVAVEFARLTHQAVSSNSDTMVSDLSNAMKIAERNMREGGRLSAEALAEELGIGVGKVQQIADDFGITLARGINPVLEGVGATPISIGSQTYAQEKRLLSGDYAEGGHLPDQAKFQRAGTVVQWAEPETGGEWFLPDSEAKRGRSLSIARQMLAGWGYDLKKREFAEGGYRSPDDVDRPPDFSAYGNMVGYSGTEATGHEYDAVVAYMAEHAAKMAAAAAAGGGGGLAASTTGLNPDFLDRFNRWNESLGNILSITSGFRSRESQQYLYDLYLSGQGNLAAPPGSSMHEKGLAIDHSPHWEGMDETARQFGLHHPVHSPQRETWHVEPFDRGGWLKPGLTMAWNGTGKPEAVGGAGIDYDKLGRVIGDRLASVVAGLPQPVIQVDRRRLGEVVNQEMAQRRRSVS